MRGESIELWPGGAPGAKGQSAEDRPRLTPYLLNDSLPHSAVIVCPGGGYSGRAFHEGEPIAQWLNDAGIAAFVLDYRVAPYRHPAPLQDAQRAIRTVRARAKEWRIHADRVAILGFSAGGHLAASAATMFDHGKPDASDPVEQQSSRPDALIACYPVISFSQHTHGGSMLNLLGNDPADDQRRYLSLENRVTAETPPTFLWHTAADEAVPVENSLVFAAALRRHSVPFALHVFPTGSHGQGLATGERLASEWPNICVDWLRSLFW